MCCGWNPFYSEDAQQLYKNVCFGKFKFQKGVFSEDGKNFVKGVIPRFVRLIDDELIEATQLLNRNVKHRLGAYRGSEELKEHAFFKAIDWEALSQRQVVPPFKPVVECDDSLENFDPQMVSADVHDFGPWAVGPDSEEELFWCA